MVDLQLPKSIWDLVEKNMPDVFKKMGRYATYAGNNAHVNVLVDRRVVAALKASVPAWGAADAAVKQDADKVVKRLEALGPC